MGRLPAAAALFAIALVAAVPALPAGAIVAGAVDGNAHPYVGALLASSGQPLCSGVLVANQNPDDQAFGKVLLTSAHCLGKAGDGRQVRVTFGPSVATGTTFTGTFHVMPGYDPVTFANDVAIVVFNSPPPISPVGLDDGDSLPGPGTSVVTVGYGTPNTGVRKWATEIVTGSGARWLDLKFGSGNSCIADSGGPDLVTPDPDDSAATDVVALTDQGSCGIDHDFLVTTPAVRVFVNDPDYVSDAD